MKNIRTEVARHARPRAKTEKKEERSSYLPALNPSRRLITLDLNAHSEGHRKLSEKIKRNPFHHRDDDAEILKFDNENIVQCLTGKGHYKFVKKKSTPLGFMMVNSIQPSISNKSKPSHIVSYSFDQYQGMRDYNEDRVCCSTAVEVNKEIYNLFGVFDGHGGSAVSEYLKANIVVRFRSLMNLYADRGVLETLRQTVYALEQEIKNEKLQGGSCLSLLVIHKNKYYIAHVGDSRIIRSQLSKTGQFQSRVHQVTTDHKPENQQQKERIEGFGGKVYRTKVKSGPEGLYGPYRVFPGRLSVSRSMGDNDIKKEGQGRVVICEPELIEGKLNRRDFFVLMSDGGYEKFSNEEIMGYFSGCKNILGGMKKPLQTFFINSILRESSDNISMVCVLTQSLPEA